MSVLRQSWETVGRHVDGSVPWAKCNGYSMKYRDPRRQQEQVVQFVSALLEQYKRQTRKGVTACDDGPGRKKHRGLP